MIELAGRHGALLETLTGLPSAVLDDMVAAVDPLNVEQLHAESGPGQFEIVTGHKEAMEVTILLKLYSAMTWAHECAHLSMICSKRTPASHNHCDGC